MIMAWALVQSTSFPCAVSSESKVRSKQYGNKKRVIKMKCSLQTPPMRVRTFSGLRGVNAFDNMGNVSLDFPSTVTSVWRDKAFQIGPSSLFTCEAKKVIERAKGEASRLNHKFVGTEMILLGLIGKGHKRGQLNRDIASEVFESMGIKLEDARNEVEKMIGRGSESVYSFKIPLTPRARNVLQVSVEEAQRTGLYDNCFNYILIGPEHLLLGLLREGGCVVSRVLMNLGAYPNNIRTQVMEMADHEKAKLGDDYRMMPTLMEYGINITDLAVKEELRPVVGREAEIERVVNILEKHTKRNPCLVGEHGVGKTAIVEGVAQKLVHSYGHGFRGYYNRAELISLDVHVLIRGEFEERLKKMMEEIKQQDDGCMFILFIDDVHTLTGTGAPQGAISAINILKQALASGEMQCIGATTPDEYRKHIEKDPFFERLFQPVNVLEPTVDETIKILMGIREGFEDRYDVRYTHEALVAAAQLSYHCIGDGFLPGKAIDLIDEAGSRVNEKHYQADKKLVEELNDMKELRPIEIERVEKELDRVKQLRSITIEGIGEVLDRDFEKAGMLRDLQIDRNFDIWSIEERIEEMNKAGMLGADVVTKRDIEDTIASWDFHN